MRRREFITAIGAAATWPLAARAQQPAIPVVGILYSAPIDGLRDETAAFQTGLAEIGYTDGRNVSFEYRSADNHMERLRALANDLAHRRVAVNFSARTAAT